MKDQRKIVSNASYLRAALAACGAVAVLFCALNYSVDPYGIFQPPDVGGLASRPAIGTHERLHKEYAVARARARTLMLGNSRVLFGLSPRNSLLGKPAYNAGFSSSSLFEAWKMLQYAETHHQPDVVILGIDPYMLFDQQLSRPGFGALAMVAGGTAWTRWAAQLQDWETLLFSPFTAQDSLATLVAPATPAVRYVGGMRDAALMSDNNDLKKRRAKSLAILARQGTGAGQNTPVHEQAEALRMIVQDCVRNRTRLIIFFHPAHAIVLDRELKDEAHLRTQLEAARNIISDATGSVEFWSFLGFNEVTMDPIGDAGPMHYYWEVSHYREIVGNMMLARIMGGEGDVAEMPKNFGHRVDVADAKWADREVQRLQAERPAWAERIKSNPERYLP